MHGRAAAQRPGLPGSAQPGADACRSYGGEVGRGESRRAEARRRRCQSSPRGRRLAVSPPAPSFSPLSPSHPITILSSRWQQPSCQSRQKWLKESPERVSARRADEQRGKIGMTTDTKATETRAFEADVSRLLHMMVHSVYSDKDVFLRELISNAADACEKLRFEAVSRSELLGDDPKPRISSSADPDSKEITVEDNGIGMSRDDMAEALGTIARSGTRAFIERAGSGSEDTQLIGQFGVGFYSAFMVADRVDVISRLAGSEEAWRWSSDGKGSYEIAPAPLEAAPKRGTRVVLHLMDDAVSYTGSYRLEQLAKSQSGHVPVPITVVEKPGAEARDIADGTALWVRPKSEIKPEEYTDFYRGLSGQYDEPAATIHFRAEGRQEYSVLAFVPGSRPFDLFDQDRKGRMKLYVRRVFITEDADLLPP